MGAAWMRSMWDRGRPAARLAPLGLPMGPHVCSMCTAVPANTALMPCSHLFCEQCAVTMAACGTCKRPIVSTRLIRAERR